MNLRFPIPILQTIANQIAMGRDHLEKEDDEIAAALLRAV
jgi:hypothetical protein